MHLKSTILISFLFIFVQPTYAQIPPTITVPITLGLLPSQSKIFNSNGKLIKNCGEGLTVDKTWQRVKLEFYILCEALHLGGITPEFTFIHYPNHKRLYLQSLKGEVTIPSVSLWESYLAKDIFYTTLPLLDKSQFELGIYMLPSKVLKADIKSLKDLRKYSAVTHIAWKLDITTLQEMEVDIATTISYVNLYRMVHANRADFTLAAFANNPTMQQTIGNISLLPVKGIKILIPDARVFAIYKQWPQATLILNSLQKGLKILRNTGKLAQYYQTIGVINPAVKNWKVLCCNALKPPE
ncbi:type 2 periplasmic-binding domain-containing protein [Colwellia psychrerythraea]|uniref:Solute-binding protein family 3/N-terminal domain-containing protein n=1 Tax=Colwellia psychrerythraea TaxID=28229 RepID=A0A099KD85_COLPS|nr:hypothetical protein [Colwellia psychrerythraea]KGJ88285.1 hypothetical protein ND2E_4121 [Colwellia psychrerythraea]